MPVSYLKFVPGDAGRRKTSIWLVTTKQDNVLGYVRWYAQWRKYCFLPTAHSIFEEVCLREIAEFITARTREHKTGI